LEHNATTEWHPHLDADLSFPIAFLCGSCFDVRLHQIDAVFDFFQLVLQLSQLLLCLLCRHLQSSQGTLPAALHDLQHRVHGLSSRRNRLVATM
jgi:hypothetical protein